MLNSTKLLVNSTILYTISYFMLYTVAFKICGNLPNLLYNIHALFFVFLLILLTNHILHPISRI